MAMRKQLLFALLMLAVSSCKKHNDLAPLILSAGEPRIGTVSKVILDQYTITAICFDGAGNAWLGTVNQGLIRYDGKTATVFDASNSILTNAAIWDIVADKAGNLWIASNNLIKFDGVTFTRFGAKEYNLPESRVTTIAVDAADNVWFGCGTVSSGGLVRYDGKTFKVFSSDNSSLPGTLVKDIVVDGLDRVWVAVNSGLGGASLTRLTGSKMEVFGAKEIGFNPYYFGMLGVSRENKLIASLDYGLSSSFDPSRPELFAFDGNRSTVIRMPEGKSSGFGGTRICVSKNGQLWASVSPGDGVGVFSNNKWVFKNFGGEGILAFGESPNGEMWLGGKGVVILK
jgi:ligand-binding sensor domain-containing protein